MLERRDFTPQELLAWNRFLSLTLLGTALAYIGEREGSIDGFVDTAAERLGSLWAGMGGGGIEPAMLGLLLNAEALGADILSSAANPESAELVTTDLPGSRFFSELEDRFEVAIGSGDLLELAGISQDDLNRLFDILGAAVAGRDFEYQRETRDDGQRLTLQTW